MWCVVSMTEICLWASLCNGHHCGGRIGLGDYLGGRGLRRQRYRETHKQIIGLGE